MSQSQRSNKLSRRAGRVARRPPVPTPDLPDLDTSDDFTASLAFPRSRAAASLSQSSSAAEPSSSQSQQLSGDITGHLNPPSASFCGVPDGGDGQASAGGTRSRPVRQAGRPTRNSVRAPRSSRAASAGVADSCGGVSRSDVAVPTTESRPSAAPPPVDLSRFARAARSTSGRTRAAVSRASPPPGAPSTSASTGPSVTGSAVAPAASSPCPVLPPPAVEAVQDCPVCLQPLPSAAARAAHLKLCGERRGLTAAQLLAAVRLQQRQAGERAAAGLPATRAAPTARRGRSAAQQTRRRAAPSAAGDADLQMALAVSASLRDEQERTRRLEEAQLLELGLSDEVEAGRDSGAPVPPEPAPVLPSAPPDGVSVGRSRGRGGRRKGRTAAYALLSQTREERERRLCEKVAQLLAWEEVVGVQRTPGRRVASPGPTPAWDKAAQLDNTQDGYYVPELAGLVEPCLAPVTSLLKDVSLIPGRNSLSQMVPGTESGGGGSEGDEEREAEDEETGAGSTQAALLLLAGVSPPSQPAARGHSDTTSENVHHELMVPPTGAADQFMRAERTGGETLATDSPETRGPMLEGRTTSEGSDGNMPTTSVNSSVLPALKSTSLEADAGVVGGPDLKPPVDHPNSMCSPAAVPVIEGEPVPDPSPVTPRTMAAQASRPDAASGAGEQLLSSPPAPGTAEGEDSCQDSPQPLISDSCVGPESRPLDTSPSAHCVQLEGAGSSGSSRGAIPVQSASEVDSASARADVRLRSRSRSPLRVPSTPDSGSSEVADSPAAAPPGMFRLTAPCAHGTPTSSCPRFKSTSSFATGTDNAKKTSLSPAANTIVSPAVSPIASPTVSPTVSPTISHAASSAASPVANPTVSHAASSVASPTVNLSASPAAGPGGSGAPVVDGGPCFRAQTDDLGAALLELLLAGGGPVAATLLCPDGEVAVHAAVLAARCPPLYRAVVAAGGRLPLPGVGRRAAAALVRLLYLGETSCAAGGALLPQLLLLAQMFQLEELARHLRQVHGVCEPAAVAEAAPPSCRSASPELFDLTGPDSGEETEKVGSPVSGPPNDMSTRSSPPDSAEPAAQLPVHPRTSPALGVGTPSPGGRTPSQGRITPSQSDGTPVKDGATPSAVSGATTSTPTPPARRRRKRPSLTPGERDPDGCEVLAPLPKRRHIAPAAGTPSPDRESSRQEPVRQTETGLGSPEAGELRPGSADSDIVILDEVPEVFTQRLASPRPSAGRRKAAGGDSSPARASQCTPDGRKQDEACDASSAELSESLPPTPLRPAAGTVFPSSPPPARESRKRAADVAASLLTSPLSSRRLEGAVISRGGLSEPPSPSGPDKLESGDSSAAESQPLPADTTPDGNTSPMSPILSSQDNPSSSALRSPQGASHSSPLQPSQDVPTASPAPSSQSRRRSASDRTPERSAGASPADVWEGFEDGGYIELIEAPQLPATPHRPRPAADPATPAAVAADTRGYLDSSELWRDDSLLAGVTTPAAPTSRDTAAPHTPTRPPEARSEAAPSPPAGPRDAGTPDAGAPTQQVTPVNPYRVVLRDSSTPMPNYVLMLTPELKRELARIGVKPIARRKAVALLSHIYEETHPPVAPSGDTAARPAAPGAGPAAGRPLLVGGGAEPFARPREPAPAARRRSRSDSESSGSEGAAARLEEVFSRLGDDEDDDITPSQAVSGTDVPSVVRSYILSRPELHHQVLTYEPVWLESLHRDLKRDGFKIKIGQLMDYLDEECITFRTENSGRRRKSPKKKRSPKKSPKKRGPSQKKKSPRKKVD